MANFAQKKVARESIEGTGTVVPDGLELPAESVEGILAELAADEKEINQNDSEHDVLAEDADETDAQLDSVDAADAAANPEGGEPSDDDMDAEEDMPDDAADALDVAQESIRKRWGFDHRTSVARESYGSRNRRQVARESLWDDIKAFLKRIWEWLKEQGRKVKDRWLKFSNQGKSVQARSKKFSEALKKAGKLKSGKDKLSGGFIKDLTINGKFVGTDTAAMNSCLSKHGDLQKLQDQALGEITGLVEAVESADPTKVRADVKELLAHIKSGVDGEMHILGNQTFKAEVTINEEDFEGTFTVIESEGTTESDVQTPSLATLGSINTFYHKLGVEIEKSVKAYHTINQKRDKYEAAVEKLLKRIDSVKIDEEGGNFSKGIRITRKAMTMTNQAIGAAERADGASSKHAVSGLNGLLAAGIAAYDKK